MRKSKKQKINQKNNQGYSYNDYYDDRYYDQTHYDYYEEAYDNAYAKPNKNKKTSSKIKNVKSIQKIPNVERTYPEEYYEEEVAILLDNKISFTDTVYEKIKEEYSKPKEIENQKKVQVLVIAEKPSIAKAIAAAYGAKIDYDIKKNPEHFSNSGAPYLTFEGYFKGIPATFAVSSVFGHILGDGFEDKYDEWNSISPIDLFDVPIVKREEMPEKYISQTLSELAYGKDILCLFLDCDNEGENICFEVINCCYESMVKRPYQQIYRAKFSSLHPDDIKLAFSYLKNLPNKSLSSSVDLRGYLDLTIGVSFTRYLTNDILPYLDLKNLILSFGPCQTPTLGFCVKRSKEIDNFIPQLVHRVYMNLNIEKTDYISKACFSKVRGSSSDENINLSKDQAFKELEYLFSKDIAKGAVVEEVIINKYEKLPPVAMNTFELMRRASSYLKFSPYETIMLAERLYSRGYITYPRTETTKHPFSFDHKKTLRALKENTIEGSTIDTINSLLKVSSINPLSGVDRGDHPPIVPLKNDSALQKNPKLKSLYDLVKLYYLASISSPAIIEERKYVLSFEGKYFTASSRSIVNKGYLEVFPWDIIGLEMNFPLLVKDQIVKIDKFLSEEVKTSPPEHLTESELITLMEENKIGTDASISTHIQNIINRKYVKIKEETRHLIPTSFGKALIEALEEFDNELVSPKIRNDIENTASELINGNKDYKSIVESSISVYKSKLAKMISCNEQMLSIFSKHVNILKSKQKIPPHNSARRRGRGKFSRGN